MVFNSHGYLEPGLHEMSSDEIEKLFVIGFPHSSTRKSILEGYRKHLSELRSIVPEFQQLIDGSFVSNKNDPGDIDLVCIIDADTVDQLSPEKQAMLQQLLAGPDAKEKYLCDAYFAPSFPENHPHFNSYRTKRKYWMGEFGFDRQDVPKGVVLVRESVAQHTSGSELSDA